MACVVYRGKRKDDTYLYVERADDFARVPDALLRQLGELERVLELELHAARRLARADPAAVMRALRDDGFYLQLPPRDEPGLSG
ncbi:MAG TPA: YcgL domain-containing protein [Gammaproteobacteria bacterium]